MTGPDPLPRMPDPPPRAAKEPEQGFRANRIRTTHLCEHCCRDIHLLGVSVAPYPRPARWRVVDQSTVERLCEGHKDQRFR